jgi:hypothetical protein
MNPFLLSLLSAIAAGDAAPVAAEDRSVALARTFLEALASDPAATKRLADPDAMIAIGDAGLPYARFLREIRPRAAWLTSCRVAALAPQPVPPDAGRPDRPPWLRGGRLAWVRGRYACIDATGRKGEWELSILLKNHRVALLSLDRPGEPR